MGGRKPRGYWTLERSLELAATCESRFSLRKKSLTAWRVLRASGDLERLWPVETKPYGYWTVDRAVEYARQFASRTEFMRNSSRAYKVIQDHGLLDELFPVVGDYTTNWLYLIKCPQIPEFCYGGITKNYHSRFFRGVGHFNTGPVYDFMKKNKLEPKDLRIKLSRRKYPDAQAARAEKKLITILKKNHKMCINRNAGGQIGICQRKWTKEVIMELKSKYPTRTSLFKSEPGAWRAARINGWLDEIYGKSKRRPVVRFTYEDCIAVAMKCESPNEMKHSYPREYNKVQREGWREMIWAEKKRAEALCAD